MDFLARGGEAADEAGAGIILRNSPTNVDADGQGINDNGDAVFTFGLSPRVSDRSIWRKDNLQAKELIARNGDIVPGAPGSGFTHFFDSSINAFGQVLFKARWASVTGGLWETSGSGELLVIEPIVYQDQVVIVPEGQFTLDGDDAVAGVINADGAVAFTTRAFDGISTEASLWLHDQDGLRLAAIDGQSIALPDGGSGVLSFILPRSNTPTPLDLGSGNEDGKPSWFNNRGDIVFSGNIDIGLRAVIVGREDSDGDGVPDVNDNCTLVPNTGQRDTDGDGFGNMCDADLNQSGFVDFADLTLFSTAFFTADADADLNGDAFVDFADLTIFSALFFQPPGPSCCGIPLP